MSIVYRAKVKQSDLRKDGLTISHLHDSSGHPVSTFLFAYAPQDYRYSPEVMEYLMSLYTNFIAPFYLELED